MSRKSHYTLVFKAKGLFRHGLPVFYKNEAIKTSQGRGVIVPPPREEDDEPALVWWEGDLTTGRDYVMDAFTALVGPELGQAPGHHVRCAPPFCLEVDVEHPEGRRSLMEWCREQGATVADDISNESLVDLAWVTIGDSSWNLVSELLRDQTP